MNPLPAAFARCLAALVLLLALAPFALPARADIEVITLRYRSAEQITPILQPLVEPGGAITGMQNQLVIRSSAGSIADLRRVLATLDSAPR
ncbi:MAG: hypothetical protein FJY55_09160 [Betaproteobacteria bacterium]|nr:hypothetical protein [Betaproteobacteria bacterium]